MSELTDAQDGMAPHGYRNHCAECQTIVYGEVIWSQFRQEGEEEQ